MRIAYLILAHKNPSQLAELVTALDSPGKTRFYIHVDQRSADFLDSPSLKPIMDRENVFFLRDRVRVYWGGFSIVEATLRLLRKAVDEGGFEYAVLLSGQDFPIKSNRHIELFFQSHDGKEFISYTPLPSQERDWGPDIMERYEFYWRVDGVRCLLEATGSKRLQRWGWSAYSRLTTLVYRHAPGLKKRFLSGIAPYGGPGWFAISFRCATYSLNYLQDHPEYSNYYAHTLIPDESFFQTLILNSPFRDFVVNDALRFIDWDPGASSPRILTGEDFDRIVLSDRLYARKFDSTQSPDIIPKIRSHIAVDA
jgi:hypothetical protein